MNRLQKACGAFQRLRNVWAARSRNRKDNQNTPIQHRRFPKMMNINWSVSNASGWDGYCELDGSKELQTRKWLNGRGQWHKLGSTTKKTGWDKNSGERMQTTASQHWGGHQSGRRVRGRPKTTWRRMVEKEKNKAGREALGSSWGSGMEQGVLDRKHGGLIILVQRDMIMMKMMMKWKMKKWQKDSVSSQNIHVCTVWYQWVNLSANLQLANTLYITYLESADQSIQTVSSKRPV